MVAIVPQGMWHRFEAPDRVSLMTATPELWPDVGDGMTG
jgi:hypothetical protein